MQKQIQRTHVNKHSCERMRACACVWHHARYTHMRALYAFTCARTHAKGCRWNSFYRLLDRLRRCVFVLPLLYTHVHAFVRVHVCLYIYVCALAHARESVCACVSVHACPSWCVHTDKSKPTANSITHLHARSPTLTLTYPFIHNTQTLQTHTHTHLSLIHIWRCRRRG